MPYLNLSKLALYRAFTAFSFAVFVALCELIASMTGAGERCTNAHTGTGLWECDPILGFKLNSEYFGSLVVLLALLAIPQMRRRPMAMLMGAILSGGDVMGLAHHLAGIPEETEEPPETEE